MLGIDLGTSNTCAAVTDGGGAAQVVVAPFPSCVVVSPGGGVAAVGKDAKRQAAQNPRGTLFGLKRLLGRRFGDPEARRWAERAHASLVASPGGDAWVRGGVVPASPEQLVAALFAEVRAGAGPSASSDVVVTVPAHFDHAQRRAIRDAAEIAGLGVRRLINQPIAAALGAGAHKLPFGRVAVCHMGGGTFEVAIVQVEHGVIEVLATDHDTVLGGETIDEHIRERLVAELEPGQRARLADPGLARRFLEEVEKLKHSLSQVAQATIQIPGLGTSSQETLGWLRTVKRLDLESWAAPVIDRLEPVCRSVASRAGGKTVDRLILSGGMMRMPALGRRMAQVFGRDPDPGVDPDTVVALGAATEAAILEGRLEGVVPIDVTARGIGIHAGGGRFAPVVTRGSTMPAREHRIVGTSRDSQDEVAVDVFEGEAGLVAENRYLGTLVAKGLPAAPAGEVFVLFDFTVDVDGILGVSARELSTGATVGVAVRRAPGLSRAEVKRLASARAPARAP